MYRRKNEKRVRRDFKRRWKWGVSERGSSSGIKIKRDEEVDIRSGWDLEQQRQRG